VSPFSAYSYLISLEAVIVQRRALTIGISELESTTHSPKTHATFPIYTFPSFLKKTEKMTPAYTVVAEQCVDIRVIVVNVMTFNPPTVKNYKIYNPNKI
jgi:hypothetical protein